MKFFSRFADHSLDHLRESLEKANHRSPSLLPMIEYHHGYLKESTAVLTDSQATDSDKIGALARLIPALRMHMKAEDETLYRRLLRADEKIARIEALGGRDEHDIASVLADELEELGYATNWSEWVDAKARVLASLVRNHLREEENETFPVVLDFISDEELHGLGEAYVEKCRNFLAEEQNPGFLGEGSTYWSNADL